MAQSISFMNFAPALSFLVAAGLLAMMLRWPALLPLDRPNERSLHARLVPRAGGLAVIPAIVAGWVAIPFVDALLCAAVLLLAAVSLVDDIRGLPVWVRLLVHLIVAISFVILFPMDLPVLLLVIIVPCIVWSINLYNFMDGSDGLAGGMAVIGFGTYSWLAWQAGANELAMANLCVSFSALGFLLFNFPPARVFLGDSGSVPLGYLAAAMGAIGVANSLWPWWLPFVVFSPFVVDATQTLLRRALRGERVWQAHKEHCYQRLIRSGWSHRKTAGFEYGLMLVVAIAAAWGAGLGSAGVAILMAGCLIGYVLLIALVDRKWRLSQLSPGRQQ